MNSLLVGSVLAVVVNAPPAYRIEHEPTKEIEAVLTMDYRAAAPFHATQWVFVAAKAPDLPSQVKTATEVVVVGHKAEAGEPHHALVNVVVPVNGANDMKVELKIRATLQARKLVMLQPGAKHPEVPPLQGEERAQWLKSNKDLNWEAPAFREWLVKHKLHREKNETEVEYARRVFLFLAGHFKYHYQDKMDRHPAAVAHAGQSDCGGISGIYVAILRASGVPARQLPGRWAKSATAKDKINGEPFYQTHVKAEFHADGIGWIPVDPTGGVSQGAKVDDFYFGNDHGDFLCMGLPVEHEIVIKGFGKQQVGGGLQGVSYWVQGKGKLDVKETEAWEVKDLKTFKPEKK